MSRVRTSPDAPSWSATHLNRVAAAAGAAALCAVAYRAVLSARRSTSPFPRTSELDSTLSLLSEGYRFISNRCRRHGSDVFEARFMMRRVFCALGEDASRMFYVPGRFTRQRAMPLTTLTLLQDWRSVQLLDGDAHRWRKEMFMAVLMREDRIQPLLEAVRSEWAAAVRRWQQMPRVVLHEEVSDVLCGAVCAWAGVPLASEERSSRAREFVAMIEGSGSVGPRNWRAQVLRARTERWIESVIRGVRSGRMTVPPGSAAYTVAWHRDADGQLLDVPAAAVELINVLRPTVAVARFITFAALALHEHPETRAQIQGDSDEYLDCFAQEVRRFYPFFPAVGGRVRTEFDWRGHRFTKGSWVMLDLYGTNHDARIWDDPDSFKPERFRRWEGNAFSFIPQGGGGHASTHRCPGEPITIELLKLAARELAGLHYYVPPQDLRVDMANMPAIPASRFVISNVGARAA